MHNSEHFYSLLVTTSTLACDPPRSKDPHCPDPAGGGEWRGRVQPPSPPQADLALHWAAEAVAPEEGPFGP